MINNGKYNTSKDPKVLECCTVGLIVEAKFRDSTLQCSKMFYCPLNFGVREVGPAHFRVVGLDPMALQVWKAGIESL